MKREQEETNPRFPSKVLITGGHQTGGVASFAEALREGFVDLGIAAEVVPSSYILSHWHDLRDPDVLKVLSTTAVFAAPFSKRTICVAHGCPRPGMQGWIRALGIVASYKLAKWNARLVAVSHYSALHLRTIYNLRVDAVIHNPLDDLFLEAGGDEGARRDCITFAGRLHPSKRLDQVFPAIRALLHENPPLRAAIVGDGELRPTLEAAAGRDPRIEFAGEISRSEVRKWLRRTRVFVSGCEVEALGIAYLEALSQGCAVVMPASGGGLEIAPELIGSAIHLYSGAGSEPVVRALRRALAALPTRISLSAYSARAAAKAYLAADPSPRKQLTFSEVTR
ncbi:MAG: glycosyltransferase family 4 protein [Terracidiphilus sp.]